MKAARLVKDTPTRSTRYAGLGYRQDGPNLWRIVSTDSDQATGPCYRTKTELLADLDRFAHENYGY